MADYSHLSDEELEKIANGSQQQEMNPYPVRDQQMQQSSEDPYAQSGERQPSSALGTFGRHAFNAPISAIHSAMQALGIPVVPLNEAIHPSMQNRREDIEEHPLASKLGDWAPGLALTALKAAKIPSYINALSKRFNKGNEKVDQAKQELTDYQSQLYKNYKLKTPDQFGASIVSKANKIGELVPQAEEPIEPTENLLPHTGEVKAAEASTNLNKALKETKDYLYPGEEHDVMVQDFIKSRPQELRNHATKEFYGPMRESIKDINLTKSPKNFMIDGDDFSPENQKIIQDYAKQSNSNTTPLTKIFDLYKVAKDEIFRARGKSTQQNIPQAEREAAKLKVEKLEPILEKYHSILEEHLPDEAKILLAKGDKFYKDNVIPFYETKLYWEAQKGRGLGSKDLMAALRGKGKGQALLRKIMEENPNMLRALLGQKYSKYPEKLLDQLSKREEKYIDQLPSLKGMRERLRAAHEAHLNAKKDADYLQKNMEGLVKEWKEIKGAQARNAKARRDIDKLHNEIDEMQKVHDELVSKQGNLDEAIELQKKIQTRKRIMKWLIGTAASMAGISKIKTFL